MRIRVYSDLHLEHAPFEAPSFDGIDVVILAGDIDVKGRGVAFARSLGRPVIYVPGNHEYYGEAIPRFTQKLRAAAANTAVHVLDGDAAIIEGVRFLGATLWTDWRGDLATDPIVAMAHADSSMADRRKIRVSPGYGRLRPADSRLWHAKARAWLSTQLAIEHSGPTVVVTHHSPTLRGATAADAKSPLLGAYASDLEPLMGPNADAWVFGHTHFSFDERINGTRVISNPRGYPGELVPGFQPDFVLEISPS